MKSQMFKREHVYRKVRNVAPDLIVHFGGLSWRSTGGVGPSKLYLQENDTGPDGCNHSQHGAFVLSTPNLPPVAWRSPGSTPPRYGPPTTATG